MFASPIPRPRRRRAGRTVALLRVPLAGGAATSVHVASYDRAVVRPRVAVLDPPAQLAAWCRAAGVRDAIVGGFFVRPGGTPLGEVRVGGEALACTPFDAPWGAVRGCLHVADGGAALALAPRCEVAEPPEGDLLQAGPLLVRGGRAVVLDGVDPEGFSAGARQFDSDISAGRHPRAALALTEDRLLAVAVDGRDDGEAGMTLGELAAWLASLGALEALNLDGGGSASLVLDRRLRNRPRDDHGVPVLGGRAISTAVVLR